jgi:Uma2 family endonuclease
MEMLARSQIGVEELDLLPDYVDGELVHAHTKALLAAKFEPLTKKVPSTMMCGLGAQIERQVSWMVDFAVYLGARPEGRFATAPPFVALEIVSPDDLFSPLMRRLEDYRQWGVPHIWLVDPGLKRLYEYSEAGLLQYPALRLPEFDFEISAQELFKDI